jgi:hypothetical protein
MHIIYLIVLSAFYLYISYTRIATRESDICPWPDFYLYRIFLPLVQIITFVLGGV